MPSARSEHEPEGLAGAGRVGGVAAAPSTSVQVAGVAAVVEGGLADELDLDAAVEALDRPHEQVVGVVVGGRPRVRRDRVLVIPRAQRQRVAHDDPARRRLPGRLEDVRPGHVGARRRVVDAERAEAEEPRLPVEEAAEDARRVEARDAEPVDRAVGRDERARCGSRRGTRSRRSAGTATARPRSAARCRAPSSVTAVIGDSFLGWR